MKELANISKKAMAIATGAALLLGGTIAAHPQAASASGYQALVPGKAITVNLGDGNAKTLIATMPNTGYIYFDLTPQCTDGASWNSELSVTAKTQKDNKTYMDAKAEIETGTVKSYRFAFAPGTKLLLTLKQKSYWSTDPNFKCTVKLNHKTPKRFESESNNSKKKADRLAAGKTTSGLIMKDDTDWFVFKAPKTGKYKIYGTGTDISRGLLDFGDVATKVYKGHKCVNECDLQDGYGRVLLFSGKVKKGKKVYVKAYGDGSFNYAFYKLKVKRVK